MNAFFRTGVRRAVGALCVLTCLSTPAAARDPDWYGDVQYLTWDVRADEAEAAQATVSHGEVFLQPSEKDSECTWYNSCDNAGCDSGEPGAVSAWQARLSRLGRQTAGRAKKLYSACAGKLRGDAVRPLPIRFATLDPNRSDQDDRAKWFTR